jgi:hypothetical protein
LNGEHPLWKTPEIAGKTQISGYSQKIIIPALTATASGGSGFLLHYITNCPILSIELIMSKLMLSSPFNIFFLNFIQFPIYSKGGIVLKVPCQFFCQGNLPQKEIPKLNKINLHFSDPGMDNVTYQVPEYNLQAPSVMNSCSSSKYYRMPRKLKLI